MHPNIQKIRALLDEMERETVPTFSDTMFSSPDEQIASLLNINKNIWHDRSITKKKLEALKVPEIPPSDNKHLYCLVLIANTKDPIKTFERNWEACEYIFKGATWRSDWSKIVRPLAGRKSHPTGLSWRIVELGRTHQGKSVETVRNESICGIGEELPLIGALHPRWAVSMNGDTVPFVEAPDLEVTPGARGEFGCAPCLGFGAGSGRVGLSAGGVGLGLGSFGSGFFR